MVPAKIPLVLPVWFWVIQETRLAPLKVRLILSSLPHPMPIEFPTSVKCAPTCTGLVSWTTAGTQANWTGRPLVELGALRQADWWIGSDQLTASGTKHLIASW